MDEKNLNTANTKDKIVIFITRLIVVSMYTAVKIFLLSCLYLLFSEITLILPSIFSADGVKIISFSYLIMFFYDYYKLVVKNP